MDDNHKLGLFVSYYLARFDDTAYAKLNFGNQRETHSQIGEILSVNPNTVKNWRDEFDPLFGHRAGWYQRPLSVSRVQVSNALNHLSEAEVYLIVQKILKHPESKSDDLQVLTKTVEDDSENSGRGFVLRAPTGRAAEQFFIEYFGENQKPRVGKLVDTRDLGCGYDFEISSEEDCYYIEVKGLSNQEGGILFTNKEWETAKEKGDKYYIALVSSINENPQISFINNPSEILIPKENISTSIQVNWSVPAQQLRKIP